MSRMTTIVREPLLHFVLAGGLLFAGFTWLNPPSPLSEEGPVRIGQGEIGWLRETFASQWRRDPTKEELEPLVETLVREQLLAREARALGLDRDDTIVRRRLAQKLMFLVEDTTRIKDPDDQELRAFQAANTERYRSETRLTFRHVYFSPKRRPNPAADAGAALAGLSAGSPLPEGDPLPLEDSFARVETTTVASLFGASFSDAVSTLEPGRWAGPLKSAYGVHLVLVSEREEGKPHPFEAVRQALLDDWRRQKAKDTGAAFVATLRGKYGVEIEDTPDAGPASTKTAAAR